MKKQANVSKILLELLKRKKISLRTLASKTGIPLSTLSSYTTAKKASYNPDHLISLSEALDVSLDYLLTGHEKKTINLDNLPIEKLFSGYFKIRVEKIINPQNEDE